MGFVITLLDLILTKFQSLSNQA